MTRTLRSTSPRALKKDRSESKSGMDKSVRKNGAGAHSWGSLDDEAELERAALADEDLDQVQEVAHSPVRSESSDAVPHSPISEEDKELAKSARQGVFKKGSNVDLNTIARSSSAAATTH
ncbi:hypothetical protein BOTBODRAFT_28727 [Botryobasidium botryosum FD-172 SS1]|uniref:Hyaluronan/mRNA-binding protein domain-containing protein n=1 Tax=Botryobasidium botryosum (strain FD-172 SS1) TaxID=930990 RepID=A0A067N2I6_BOTB1|nr:hypothetical protein BOTBODRAFT_28727 [Botryobasidium botryosum FD-172 SS1]